MTKEQRIELLKQNLWTKCSFPGCLNPSRMNNSNSFCSYKCQSRFFIPQRVEKIKSLIRNNPEWWSRIHYKSDEQKKKYSIANKKRFKDKGPRVYVFDKESIDTSRTVVLGMERGKAIATGLTYLSPKGKFKRRYYRKSGIPYRTEWDFKAFKYFDENPLVISWTFLGKALPYHDKSRKLPKHIPIDFEVTYKNGLNQMVLIRPEGIQYQQLESLRAIEEYCEKNKIELEIWTREQFTRF